jgi:nitroreductase
MTSLDPGVTSPDAELLDGLLSRRYSCRAYRDEQVPRPVVEQILRTAQKTASWCNSQPWQLVVAGGSATDRFRRALSAHAREGVKHQDIPFPARYEGAYQQRRRECGFQLYEAVGVARGDREASAVQGAKNFEFFGAPHVAIVTTTEALGTYGAVDCGAYVSSFLLAAQSNGVAAIAQAAVANHSDFIRDWFSIPENRWVVCGIAFGYADEDDPANRFRTRRADLEEVVTWVEQ